MFWLIPLLFIGSLIAGELMRPKPKDSSRPASLSEYGFPTADVSRPIPVIWGTVKIDGPNILWYGDFRQHALTRNVRSGLFSSTRQTLGFRYYFGIDYALCWGVVNSIYQVWSEGKIVWQGPKWNPNDSLSVNTAVQDIGGGGQEFVIDGPVPDAARPGFYKNARYIYGGDSDVQLEQGGEGGVYARVDFYSGRDNSIVNPYLQGFLNDRAVEEGSPTPVPLPAYRGISHCVFNGPSSPYTVYDGYGQNGDPYYSGYMGVSQSLKPLEFVVIRCPNMLSQTNEDNYYYINGDANPVDCILELLTNKNWSIGLLTSSFDLVKFKEGQTTVFNEGLGFSAIWDSPREVLDIVNELLRYIDGTLFTDINTGLISIELARDDYDTNNLIILNEDNSELLSYSQPSYYDTTNEVRVKYLDRDGLYKEKVAIAQDLANFMIQKAVVATDIDYIGPSNLATASKLAYRDLRVLTTPLAKVTIQASKIASSLRPGKVFKLNWNDFDTKIDNQIFRVINIGYGTDEDNKVRIEAVEDVFSLKSTIYGTEAATEWVNPIDEPQSMDGIDFPAIEAPYAYTKSNDFRVMTLQPEIDSSVNYDMYTSTNNVDYVIDDQSVKFTNYGIILNPIPAVYTDKDSSTIEIINQSVGTIGVYSDIPEYQIKLGKNIGLIISDEGSEFIAFEKATFIEGATTFLEELHISDIWRGLFDTTPIRHESNIKIYLLNGYGVSSRFDDVGNLYTKIKVLGSAFTETGFSNEVNIVNTKRSLKPYAPAFIKNNTSATNLNIGVGVDLTVEWSDRNRIFQENRPYTQHQTGIVKEGGTSYYIRFYHGTSGTLLRTVGPLTGNSYTYTLANQMSDNSGVEPTGIIYHLYSHREGLSSFTSQVRSITKNVAPVAVVPYTPHVADNFVPEPSNNANYINGYPVESGASNGDILVFNGSGWIPSNPDILSINGDVDGTLGSSVVRKIQGISVSNATPNTNDVLQYSGGLWIPNSISGGSGSTIKSYTNGSTSAMTYTSINIWEDLSGLSVSFSTAILQDLVCVTTIKYRNTNTNNDTAAFRFTLNGNPAAEVWENKSNSSNNTTEYRTVTLHAVFRNISAGSQNIKVQWQSTTIDQDIELLDRRISVVPYTPSYDVSFTPTSISSLRYWFKADGLTGLSNGNNVGQLSDFSGLNNHFIQLFSSNQATFLTNALNGLPAVRFNYLNNQYYTGTGFMSSFTQGEMYFIMRSSADPSVSNNAGGYCKMTTDTQLCHYPYIDGSIYDNWGSQSRFTVGNPPTPLNNFNIYNVQSSSGLWNAYLNRTLTFNSTSNTVGFSTSPSIGQTNGTAFFDGDIAEVLIFNSVLNNTDRENLSGYFAYKYGI